MRGIPALLAADAHEPARLRWDYERGYERLREAGYEEISLYEARRRSEVPLPDQEP